jgi:adenylylsulfate kinase
MKRILIMGLPGAGKTTLAAKLVSELGHNCLWLNADDVRKKYNDWDFSQTGRIRQSQRMRELSDASDKKYVIVDFVAPLTEMRSIFSADFTIWMDTIVEGRYSDTNTMFVPPTDFDLRIKDFNYNIINILEALL